LGDNVQQPALIEKFELRADVLWQGTLAGTHDSALSSLS